MNNFRFFLGGVRMGLVRITMPLASLIIKPNLISLNVLFFRIYNFSKNEVINFSETDFGLEIKTILPKRIVFWCLNPKLIIKSISEIGFTPQGNPKEAVCPHGFPIRIISLFMLLLLWGISYFLDRFIPPINIEELGFFRSYGVLLNLFIFFLFAIIWFFKPLQKIILRSKSDFEEVKPEFFTILLIMIIFWFFVIVDLIKELL